MKSRAIVEQAEGLMRAQNCNADDAFQMLVRGFQRENRKLREIAARLVSAPGSRHLLGSGAPFTAPSAALAGEGLGSARGTATADGVGRRSPVG